jgi:hypothetical protein
MSRGRSISIAIALGLLLVGGLPAGADPGKITKYVLPDGTVVYSDTPVPGAKVVGEIVVPPSPSKPPAAPATGTTPAPQDAVPTAPPPGPDDTPPVIAEDRDGKCYLRVTSGWQWVEIHVEGLVPGERFVMELRADGELTLNKTSATDAGERGWVLFPAMLAKSGANSITVRSSHCELSASFHWPQ